MVVRRLFFHRQGQVDESCGAVEFVWEDRSVTRIDTRSDWSLSISDREWTDPFAQTPSPVDPSWVSVQGKWQRHDVSRRPEYLPVIGRPLRAVSVINSGVGQPVGVDLEFAGSTVSVRSVGGEPLVEVIPAVSVRQFVRVSWRHDLDDEPVTMLYESLDGVERRKIEMWRDGHTGFATAFVARGGSTHSLESLPGLEQINQDPQFEAVEITREEFEHSWDHALAGAPAVTLWRPVGPKELDLVKQTGWRRWPPRLPDQPIFYAVLTEDYAARIARDWNVPASGIGYVTRFQILTAYLDQYPVHQAGGQDLVEYWIPAEGLDDFNDHLVGPIEITATYQ